MSNPLEPPENKGEERFEEPRETMGNEGRAVVFPAFTSLEVKRGNGQARRPRKPNLKWTMLEAWAPCRRCGLPCLTTRLGGRIPMHPDCDRYGFPAADTEAVVAAAVELHLGLGAELVTEVPPPRTTGPDTEMGPCPRCSAPIRRYGPYAEGLCRLCRRA